MTAARRPARLERRALRPRQARTRCARRPPASAPAIPAKATRSAPTATRTATAALAGWQRSPGHDALLAERGGWADPGFAAIGVGAADRPRSRHLRGPRLQRLVRRGRGPDRRAVDPRHRPGRADRRHPFRRPRRSRRGRRPPARRRWPRQAVRPGAAPTASSPVPARLPERRRGGRHFRVRRPRARRPRPHRRLHARPRPREPRGGRRRRLAPRRPGLRLTDDAFDGRAGALRFAEGMLAGDQDGDRRADFAIALGASRIGRRPARPAASPGFNENATGSLGCLSPHDRLGLGGSWLCRGCCCCVFWYSLPRGRPAQRRRRRIDPGKPAMLPPRSRPRSPAPAPASILGAHPRHRRARRRRLRPRHPRRRQPSSIVLAADRRSRRRRARGAPARRRRWLSLAAARRPRLGQRVHARGLPLLQHRRHLAAPDRRQRQRAGRRRRRPRASSASPPRCSPATAAGR